MNRVKDLLYNTLQTSELFVNSQKLEIREKDRLPG